MFWSKWKSGYTGIIRRVEAIDLFKFWVLFFMIEGHLFRTYLLPAIRQQSWFEIHEVLHGMVAPGFLFSAGFGAFLSFYNKREQATRLNRAFFDRLRRVLFVVWMGYWIHLPALSLRGTITLIRAGKEGDFFRTDILQCIGIGLIIFLLMTLLLKKERWIALFSFIFCLVFFLIPNVVKKIEIPYLLNPYLHHELSNFPLFPWAGFLFLGVLAAYAYSVLQREIFFRFCLIFGAAIFPWYFFFKSEAFIKAELTLAGNLNKLGGVLLLLWFSERIVCRWKGKTITLMTRAGKESLFVYVLHLFIIFGSVFSPGLQPLLENTMTLPQATGLFLLLQTIVFGLSLTYGYLKDKKKPVWRWGFNAFWAGFFILFALKRW
jgi:uncharacterized membrane protein